jgi:hypothetical protein
VRGWAASGSGTDTDLELSEHGALAAAKRISLARANSLPAPRARPRMAEIVTAGSLLSRIRTSN